MCQQVQSINVHKQVRCLKSKKSVKNANGTTCSVLRFIMIMGLILVTTYSTQHDIMAGHGDMNVGKVNIATDVVQKLKSKNKATYIVSTHGNWDNQEPRISLTTRRAASPRG
jgi:ABC-type uncharacterized transport system ATPase component